MKVSRGPRTKERRDDEGTKDIGTHEVENYHVNDDRDKQREQQEQQQQQSAAETITLAKARLSRA